MTNFTIREAVANDTPHIINFLRAMLDDMTAFGGYPTTKDHQLWARIEKNINLDEADHRFWMAEIQQSIGFIEARMIYPDLMFQPRRLLHIHAVYVAPEFRGKGIGRALVQIALDWGRANNCHSAQLNTLVENPTRLLYEQLGFQAREVKMLVDL